MVFLDSVLVSQYQDVFIDIDIDIDIDLCKALVRCLKCTCNLTYTKKVIVLLVLFVCFKQDYGKTNCPIFNKRWRKAEARAKEKPVTCSSESDSPGGGLRFMSALVLWT